MKIRNIAHKGLRRFVENDDPSGIPSAFVGKIRNIVSFLQDMSGHEELRLVPGWRVHLLTGDRKGTWSIAVTRNWRVTLRIDADEGEIVDLNFEDYH
jgi:proteic killer suppression protein